MDTKYKKLKAACYFGNISMSVTANLSPLLFITFRNHYNISYSLLGLLILINFFTQLGIDLVFSFFSHKFNIKATVRLMPVLSIIGFILYALSPVIFGENLYVGLFLSTIIFSASSGLAEVLLSPIIASIPSDDPDREMSKLHSVFAWGVVGVVVFATLFLLTFGYDKWQLLTLILTVLPLCSAILFFVSDIPTIETPKKTSSAFDLLKHKGVWLCFAAIFLGGAAECTMSQWASGYLENALGIQKVWGDIFGVALFSIMMGMGRTLYSKFGKNIEKLLFFGAIGATLCYLITAISPIPIIGLFSCGLTGFFVSMMWPGSLIISSDRYPNGGVFIYALMAAGGDLGASVGPQLVGLITDLSVQNTFFSNLSHKLNITTDSLGMKLGILVGMLFPLIAIFVFRALRKPKKQ